MIFVATSKGKENIIRNKNNGEDGLPKKIVPNLKSKTKMLFRNLILPLKYVYYT
jgi:hypothetical protein